MTAAENRSESKGGKVVNFGVDTLLRLVPFSDFEQLDRDHHRIRLLQVGKRCEVLGSLKEWAKSSRDDYDRIVNGLRRIAENEDRPQLNTIRRVGSEEIVEVKGGNARLFYFYDNDSGYTVVCVGTFWIGHGDKRTMQNKAIREAERRMALWREATPVEGQEDFRVL